MAYNYLSPCVYNIPVALDATLSHPAGFEPEFARHRCKTNLSNSMDCIIGPMPALNFVDHFLSPEIEYDYTQKMSSENAFRSVPTSAASVSEICRPLVSSSLLASFFRLNFSR